MRILVTGCAGFIGYHIVKKLLKNDIQVIGIDNINDYYSTKLKKDRLRDLGIKTYTKRACTSSNNFNFIFHKIDISNKDELKLIFKKYDFDIVLNLAAQAGVRFSLTHPEQYINSNIVGFFNIISLAEEFKIKKFIYASSSSVYGDSKKISFDENQSTSKPLSIYAATKKSNELIAYSYSHIYNIQTIGLRFFTVYGPWGRPDMAVFSFTKNILEKKPINVFHNGNLFRDFTYIDDIVQSIFLLIISKKINSNYEIFNIGNSKPVKIIKFIQTLEECLKIKAKIVFKDMQAGDVLMTCANTKKLERKIQYSPNTDLKKGLYTFVNWYKSYYK